MSNFAASIIARLGLDTSGFRSELAAAGGAAQNAHDKMSGSAGRNADAHEKLFTSSHRAARQIQNIARDAASGASAMDLFSAGLEGAERALRLPLGALAGLGIGAIAVQQIARVVSEYKKLEEEVTKFNSVQPDARFETFEQIRKQADEAAAKIDDLQKKVAFWKQFTGDQKLNIEVELEETQAKRANLQTAEVQKLAFKNEQHPDFLNKAADIESKFMDTVQRLGQRGVVQLEKELENLAADVARMRRERVQGSLDEIAKRPNFDNSLTIQAASEGQLAREALAEIEAAKNARDTIGGTAGLEEAQRHLNRADQIKSGIESLKDSEKDLTGAFKGALDSSAILQKINENIQKINFWNY